MSTLHTLKQQENNINSIAYLWMDGAFLPASPPLSLFTHGLHYGTAVFEGIRGYQNKAFELKAHLERFLLSSARLSLPCPYGLETLIEACEILIMRSHLSDFYLRPLLWTGDRTLGISSQNANIHTALLLWHWEDHFSAIHKKGGLSLMPSDWLKPSSRSVPVQAKTSFLYGPNVMSKAEIEKKGYDDALFFDHRGRVMESTGANIFFVKNNALHTPIPDYFLNGITRQKVLKIAEKNGIKTYQRDIFKDEIETMDECFLTGTAYEICAVSLIEQHHFSCHQTTDFIKKSYQDLVEAK